VQWLGALGLAAFLGLLVVHRIVARRYLHEYVTAHGRMPGWSWIRRTDENPTVEHWRRRRLAVALALLVISVPVLLWLSTTFARSPT